MPKVTRDLLAHQRQAVREVDDEILYKTASEVPSVTLKIAWPAEFARLPAAGAITDEPFNAVEFDHDARCWVLVVVFRASTVTVDADLPSAGTLVGLACTND